MVFPALKMGLIFFVSALGVGGCDNDDGLEPIEEETRATGDGNCGSIEASASFENNFGLKDFCINYEDKGAGLVVFDFTKSSEQGIGRFSVELPHTEIGHVFEYNTKEMITEHELMADHCEILKSSSKYPAVTLTASDGNETVKASSLDCDKKNFFDVTINTIQVPEAPGQKWIYELSAKYARQDKGPYYLKGRFEVKKR